MSSCPFKWHLFLEINGGPALLQLCLTTSKADNAVPDGLQLSLREAVKSFAIARKTLRQSPGEG